MPASTPRSAPAALLLALMLATAAATLAAATCPDLLGAAFSFGNSRRLLQDSDPALPPNTSIPDAIALPAGAATLLGAFTGVGYQHYGFNGTVWVLQNATAWLESGDNDTVVGRHFYLPTPDAQGGQPSWRLGSSQQVTAKSIAKTTVDSDSITWNLLQTSSYQLAVSDDAAAAADAQWSWVGDVTHVQRLSTQKGLPPDSTADAQAGDVFSSVYSAIYAFYSVSS